ncbi:hypothetical protein [Paenibacillus koleovorans]|uniref:hypothetical protein n=1 Tax=Paenibacillus koleovorans TaxID=121608 RepID=UPI0027D7A4B5|nr:hypothetical protein [Paenibacillus koleovorans]
MTFIKALSGTLKVRDESTYLHNGEEIREKVTRLLLVNGSKLTPVEHATAGGFELSRFLTPPTISDHRTAPVNALGYLRVMFTVEDIDEMVARLTKHGAQLVGEVVQYGDSYRLCYIRGTEGLLIGLAEQLGK